MRAAPADRPDPHPLQLRLLRQPCAWKQVSLRGGRLGPEWAKILQKKLIVQSESVDNYIINQLFQCKTEVCKGAV